jgi:hypothetical protein
MKKTISAMTAAAFFAVCATGFAQAPAPESAPASPPNQDVMVPPSAQAPTTPPSLGEDEKKPDKPVNGGKAKGKTKGEAKKANKKHGLDRADEAAGHHGKQGREKARANQ